MKSDAKIALVTLALIVLVIVAYVVFVPAKAVTSTAGTPAPGTTTPGTSTPGTSAPAATPSVTMARLEATGTQNDAADATVASAVQPAGERTTAAEPANPTTSPGSTSLTAAITPAAAHAAATQPAALTVTAAPAAGTPPVGTSPSVNADPYPAGPSVTPIASPTAAPAAAPAAAGGNVDWEGVLRGARSVENARVASSTVTASTVTAPSGVSTASPNTSGPQVSLGTPPAGQPLVGSAVSNLPTSTAATFTGGTYTIGRGDTLSTVAQKAYGSAALWPHIARANPEVNPNRLKLGTVLRIPDVATVRGASASLPAESTTTSGSSLVVDPAREYQIVSGDSLEKISRKLYGDASKVNAIYDLNREVIGADPARLRVRTVLKLPTPPTAAR